MASSSDLDLAAILVAGGRGQRLGGELKQFRTIGGVPVLARAAAALRRHPAVGRLVVVVPAEEHERARAMLPGGLILVSGGDTRRASVLEGLRALAGRSPDRVLVHDAARPDLPVEVIDRLLAVLDDAQAACPVLPVPDTLVERDGLALGVAVDRAGLQRVQTPQAFHFDTLLAAHSDWAGEEPTDDAQMVRTTGCDVVAVEGDERLHKLTWASDFARMEAQFGQRVSVTGSGFDVHRLEAGEELWLCGLKLEHELGLSGHSDADVGLHALTDALLGAIGAGDIGDHFPPADERWRGARSDQFLAHAIQLAQDAGARLEHLDVTLICEQPKIGPHKVAMRERIAAIVGLPVTRVSVKATTTEALGFTGRGEGIAAQATATVSLLDGGHT